MQQYDGDNFVFVMNLFNVDVEAWEGAPPAPSHMAKQLAHVQHTRLQSANSNQKLGGNWKGQKRAKRAVEFENAVQQDDGGLGPDMFFTMSPRMFRDIDAFFLCFWWFSLFCFLLLLFSFPFFSLLFFFLFPRSLVFSQVLSCLTLC